MVTLNFCKASWCVSPAIDSPLSSRISSPVGRGRNCSWEEFCPIRRRYPLNSSAPTPRPGFCEMYKASQRTSHSGLSPWEVGKAAVLGLLWHCLLSRVRSRVLSQAHKAWPNRLPAHLWVSPLSLLPLSPSCHSLPWTISWCHTPAFPTVVCAVPCLFPCHLLN